MSYETNSIKNCAPCQQIIEHRSRKDAGNHTCGRESETIERMIGLFKVQDLIDSGYAGINRKGTIVDRREDKDAVPIQKNSLFGTPPPKEVK